MRKIEVIVNFNPSIQKEINNFIYFEYELM